MEKSIWLLNNIKTELIEAQRMINANGGLKAFCMLSDESFSKAMERHMDSNRESDMPSLIILDYNTEVLCDFKTVNHLKQQPVFAGVPLFFMVDSKSYELDEECYQHGATVVISKPFSRTSIIRIERTALQYEMTKNYEKMLQSQTGEILAAKEISRLNKQLQSRNNLLHQIFGRYFSDEVVDMILENPQGAAVGGVKKEVTVMMTDLRGFTAISDKLEPEIVADMLNHFLGTMTDIIAEYGGTVIEFIGDAILAVFGVLEGHEESADDAIAAAICMQNSMQQINELNKSHEYPSIEMGIGIHKGQVFVGNIGSNNMMRYNVIGQAVNLCSRIEGYSVGGQILVSFETVNRLTDRVNVSNTFEITVKGIAQPISICDVRGIKGKRCYDIECADFDILKEVDEEVSFRIYVIQDKKITPTPLDGKMISFSRKRAKVFLPDSDDKLLFQDAMVTAMDVNGRTFFSKVYAKITKVAGNEITIHFTYVTDAFIDFYDRISKQ